MMANTQDSSVQMAGAEDKLQLSTYSPSSSIGSSESTLSDDNTGDKGDNISTNVLETNPPDPSAAPDTSNKPNDLAPNSSTLAITNNADANPTTNPPSDTSKHQTSTQPPTPTTIDSEPTNKPATLKPDEADDEEDAPYTDASRFWGIPKLRPHSPPDLTVISPGFDMRLRAHRAVFSAYSRHFHKTLECGEDFLPVGPSLLNYNEGANTLTLAGGPPVLWATKILCIYHLHIYPTPSRGGMEARITAPMIEELRGLMERKEELDPFGVEALRELMGKGEVNESAEGRVLAGELGVRMGRLMGEGEAGVEEGEVGGTKGGEGGVEIAV